MFRHHIVLALWVAAASVAASACQDERRALGPVDPFDPGVEVEDEPLASYPGFLEAPDRLRSGAALIPLAGWQTSLFANLVGAEVLIEGVMDADPESGLVIHDFQLLAVDGIPVLDGMLGQMEEGYFIRGKDGVVNTVGAVPTPLQIWVGRRVWLSRMNGQTVRYGVLEPD